MDQKGFLLLVCLSVTMAKELELPLCPTNVQFFPQTLPMHCRMPRSADPQPPASFPGIPGFPGISGIPGLAGLPGLSNIPGMPPGTINLPEAFFQNRAADKQPNSPPIQITQNSPGPAPFPMPGGPFPVAGGPFAMPGGPAPIPGGPAPMPGGPAPMPGGPFAMPGGPMPMMPMPGPAHKLPVIVMPFYSPDPSFKKPGQPGPPLRPPSQGPMRPRFHDRDSEDTDMSSDTSSDTSSDFSRESRWKRRRGSRKSARRSNRKYSHKSKRRHNKTKKELLTPLLQYVTKDGYVIFEKKISKGEAKDWLRIRKDVDKTKREDVTDSSEKYNDKEDETLKVESDKEQKKTQEATDKEDNESKEKENQNTNEQIIEIPRANKKHKHYTPNLLLENNNMKA